MSGLLIHQRFEAQVEANPLALAAICGDESLTYAQLNAQANRIAHRLQNEGVRPDELVAIWASRSITTLIHLLAVAKSGAAFLPVDPSYPRQRLEFMLSNAAARFLLAPEIAQGCLPIGLPGLTTIELSNPLPVALTVAANSAADDALNVGSMAASQNLAYVIYTSGSTGQPKGVMIEHAAVVNTLDDVNARFGVGPGDRVLCLSSFGFDLSVYDVFGVLSAGGTVVLPTETHARDPAAWCDLILRHGVTIWNTVPALMQWMVSYCEANSGNALRSLRLVLLSGDWIPVSLPDRIRGIHPAAEIVSLGGATEAAIWSIYYRVGRVDAAWSKIPYGRALSGQTIHVLDYNQRPCDPGVLGELYIGGAGVARGYLNQPELTAEQFSAEPFSKRSTDRLYRTGDLGRLLPDGEIELLGRADNQVKINGYRIELGEIETLLAQHPRVREAVVVAPRDANGRLRLVAFFVPTCAAAPTESVLGPTHRELREHLAQRLPIYMLPSQFTECSTLPLTANGKIDRAALSFVRGCESHPGSTSAAFQPAESPIETQVAAIWRDVLNLDTADRDEHFVDAGGDSLQTVTLILRINSTFGINLPVTTPMLDAPTIAELAARVETALVASRRGAIQRESA